MRFLIQKRLFLVQIGGLEPQVAPKIPFRAPSEKRLKFRRVLARIFVGFLQNPAPKWGPKTALKKRDSGTFFDFFG